jgi:hypothetical protein
MGYPWYAGSSWNLLIFNDTVCYLGWLDFFDAAWLVGITVCCHTDWWTPAHDQDHGRRERHAAAPHITRTWDLFRHVGYWLGVEETFRGPKNSVDDNVLIALFLKAPEAITTEP